MTNSGLQVLGGETAAGVRPEDGWQTEAGFDDRIGAWTGPFGMEKINVTHPFWF